VKWIQFNYVVATLAPSISGVPVHTN